MVGVHGVTVHRVTIITESTVYVACCHKINLYSMRFQELSFTFFKLRTAAQFNPLLPGVPDREQHELCSVGFEITRAVV